MEDQKAIVVGISGCSSSGKTTLARLLRDIFPNTFILHEDDFYKPEEELPIKDGLVDWDCAEAISIPDMQKALTHIRTTGTFPPFIDSKEDQNTIGACPASSAQIAAAKQAVQAWLAPGQPGSLIFSPSSPNPPPPRICLLDGFLLFSPPLIPTITSLIDIKLFLLVSRAAATRRRQARDGYVTLEGFWADPPGYVDRIVWPNYAESHAWLFEAGNVEGKLDEKALATLDVRAQTEKGLDVDFGGETLPWAVEAVMKELERIVLGGGGEGSK
ncbi:P-loop containing nucleoside triphosphate hydrolase protein [Bombardia bombarda]|uniref:P-loop containing nucleoside triphosphate hydrolase protein n=1 Tax=Bombardia bombarda TaxID=252184 RepID=A0AA39XIL1_9PEZI|nr:P-loop containing nucleoside triphosphate hydrolase protein [Bombardia bombarda]